MAEPALEGLLQSVEGVLGIDAYRIYPNSQRLIAEAVLVSVAAACIGQFLKGLIDFEKLGSATRQHLDELIRRWRQREAIDAFADAHDPRALLDEALRHLPRAIQEHQKREALEALQAALEEFGLPRKRAEERARAIAQLVVDYSSRDS